jgi:hypothetical protein
MANLKRFGEVTGNYGADYEDRFWTFSWKEGDRLSQYDDLNYPANDLQAAQFQAHDILRRRFDEDFPRLSSWLPHVSWSSLVLADYLDEPLPLAWIASPGDAYLLEWQKDPYSSGSWLHVLRALRSSYLLPPAFVSPDESPTITQATYTSWYVPWDVQLGGRTIDEVAFPSQKVHLSESAAWFFGPRPLWYLELEARVPMLMVDGSTGVRRTADANAAGNPDDPAQDDYLLRYRPSQDWEAPAFDPAGDVLSGKHRWTRGGLKGIDFDGERVE